MGREMRDNSILNEFLFEKKHVELKNMPLFNCLRDIPRILLKNQSKSDFSYKGDINRLSITGLCDQSSDIGSVLSNYIGIRRANSRRTLNKYKREFLIAIRFKLKVDHKLSADKVVLMAEEFNRLFNEFHNIGRFKMRSIRKAKKKSPQVEEVELAV